MDTEKKTQKLTIRLSKIDQVIIRKYAQFKGQDVSHIIRNYLVGSAKRAGIR